MNYEIKQLFSEQMIQQKVAELARQIDDDLQSESVILIGLLRGSAFFLSDLSRKMETDAQIDFMTVSSYGNNTTSNRDVRVLKDLDGDIFDQNIIIVEDIIDTGYTLKKVVEILKTRKPKTLKICTLLDKPSRREVEVKVDYCGFTIDDAFVVGYGIDYAQKHRTLPYIGHVIFKEEV
ncbi:MAG: hypoxanthine phosphoribosyltransferase [Culicoidibacterales bacterium]